MKAMLVGWLSAESPSDTLSSLNPFYIAIYLFRPYGANICEASNVESVECGIKSKYA